MEDGRLYARFKHTIGCRLEVQGTDSDSDWQDLDVYSEHEDPVAALQDYLTRVYEGEAEVKELRKGEFSVAEPVDPSGSTKRFYKLP